MIRLQTNNSNVDIKYPNIKGEDGGYYIPSVDENGVLSWTASEEGMEEVATASIQGKDGEPGPVGPKGDAGKDTVWVGDTEPTEDYNVWIAPGGGATEGLITQAQMESYVGEQIAVIELTPGPQGPQGEPGEDGEDGYSPVKGVDYWTEEDQTAIVNDVLAALPAAEEVSV